MSPVPPLPRDPTPELGSPSVQIITSAPGNFLAMPTDVERPGPRAVPPPSLISSITFLSSSKLCSIGLNPIFSAASRPASSSACISDMLAEVLMPLEETSPNTRTELLNTTTHTLCFLVSRPPRDWTSPLLCPAQMHSGRRESYLPSPHQGLTLCKGQLHPQSVCLLCKV